MTIARPDWNFADERESRFEWLQKLRVMLWVWWRKPTKAELYKWVLAEFPGTKDAIKENLDTLTKTEMLYKQTQLLLRRIEIERSLLASEIEEAKQYELSVDWVKSTAKEIMSGRLCGFYWNSKLLS